MFLKKTRLHRNAPKRMALIGISFQKMIVKKVVNLMIFILFLLALNAPSGGKIPG
jgi:hypothetical protein